MAHRDEEGILKRQKINSYIIFLLCILGFGSITYGYTASIIGTTLGKLCVPARVPRFGADSGRATILHRVL